ncbi:MAG: hypothetical protein LBH31_09335 [Burkholderiaceae bacterium]|nr:hypothetical protein [Burkholderiaceae bacterium]
MSERVMIFTFCILFGFIMGGMTISFYNDDSVFLRKCIIRVLLPCICFAMLIIINKLLKQLESSHHQGGIGIGIMISSYFITILMGKKIFMSKSNEIKSKAKESKQKSNTSSNNKFNKYVALLSVIVLAVFSLYQIYSGIINGVIKPIEMNERNIFYASEPFWFIIWLTIHFICVFIYIGGYLWIYKKK